MRAIVACVLVLMVVPNLSAEEQLKPVVEVEENIYHYVPANNGAGPTWCFGAPILVRMGEELFATALETLPDAQPLHNVRWMLFKRGPARWELQQVDPVGRTREPCPLVGLPDGRLLLSASPSLVPERRVGPARPELLEFSAAQPKAPFKTHLPPWKGTPAFAEHTYRFFGADASTGDVMMLNQVGYTHKEWALMHRDGSWLTGQLANVPSREGDIDAYQDKFKCHRTNYGSVALAGRAVHVTGCVSYANWDRMGRKDLEKELKGESARQHWGSLANRRRMMYTWTPDIGSKPFGAWLELGSTMSTGGWLFPGDLWLDADGAAHVVWYEGPLDKKRRDAQFPDIKLTHSIKYAIVREGRIVHRATLVEGGEGLGDEIPEMIARFQVTPDRRLLVVYCISGRNSRGERTMEDRIMELRPDRSTGVPVALGLRHPLRVIFTATPRGGSPPSKILDMAGIRSDATPGTLSYARVRLW